MRLFIAVPVAPSPAFSKATRSLRAADTALYGPLNGVGDFWARFHELGYADDVDFISGDLDKLNALVPMLGPRFVEVFNLRVNAAKTERRVLLPNPGNPTHFKKPGAHQDIRTKKVTSSQATQAEGLLCFSLHVENMAKHGGN